MGAVGPGDLVEVREGLARLLVPKGHPVKGPGRASGRPFYNGAMALPRHVSVLVLGAVARAGTRVLDALAATGVLGIRFGLEVAEEVDVTLNDRREDALQLMRRNAALNGVSAAVEGEDAHVLLARRHFDYVDVDPFGSPVPFVEAALRSLAPRGTLALTATDTAPLAGTYPRTCRRRYGATSLKGPYGHEVGLRILAGFVVRAGARYDLAVRPLLCLWRGHFYKAFFAVQRGARRADEALEALRFVRVEDGERTLDGEGQAGPLWGGPLHDASLLARMEPREHMPGTVATLLDRWREEAEAPPLFYTTDEVASRLRRSPPPLRRAIEALEAAGFAASRTHLHPKGFKTDAPWEAILDLLRDA